MRVLLMLPKPSAHWNGLANLICESDGLREDITLVVDGEQVRFFDSLSAEMAVYIPREVCDPAAISQLSGKLALLEWLHQHFPKVAELDLSRTGVRPRFHLYRGTKRPSRNMRFNEPMPAN